MHNNAYNEIEKSVFFIVDMESTSRGGAGKSQNKKTPKAQASCSSMQSAHVKEESTFDVEKVLEGAPSYGYVYSMIYLL